MEKGIFTKEEFQKVVEEVKDYFAPAQFQEMSDAEKLNRPAYEPMESGVKINKSLMHEVIQQEALTRLLVEKGIFTKEELLEMVKVVNRERKRGNQ